MPNKHEWTWCLCVFFGGFNKSKMKWNIYHLVSCKVIDLILNITESRRTMVEWIPTCDWMWTAVLGIHVFDMFYFWLEWWSQAESSCHHVYAFLPWMWRLWRRWWRVRHGQHCREWQHPRLCGPEARIQQLFKLKLKITTVTFKLYRL